MLVGKEAKKVYQEALQMLDNMVNQNLLQAKGIVGFYAAQVYRSVSHTTQLKAPNCDLLPFLHQSVGDDIYLYSHESEVGCNNPKGILHGLRQQAEVESQHSYQCISDFVPPKSTGQHDYVGMFAVSTGFGCQELCQR